MDRVYTIPRIYCIVLVFLRVAASGQAVEGLTGEKLDIDIDCNILVLNANRSTLESFTKDRIKIREIGGPGWQNDQFDRPSGVWARNGIDVFVADYGNHRIQRFDRYLNYVSTLYTRENPIPEERFGYPSDVTLSRLGYLFVCDTENSRIIKFNQFSQVERTFGGFDAGKGRLYAPTQVECGPKDRVYVVDGARVLVYDNFGNFLHLLPGVFRPRVTLYADNESVVVVDSVMTYCFDKEDRPVTSLSLESLLGLNGNEIKSVAFSQDSMFVLSTKGLLSVVDPRRMTQQR